MSRSLVHDLRSAISGVGDDVFGDQIGRQGKALERAEPIETVDRYPRDPPARRVEG